MCGEPNCAAELQLRSRKRHWRMKHGKEDYSWATAELDREAEGGWNYEGHFAPGQRYLPCPHGWCGVTPRGSAALRNHWSIRHPYDTFRDSREGPNPLDVCGLCGTHVTNEQWNGRHQGSPFCRAGIERRRKRVLAREIGRANEVTFQVNGEVLERVNNYCYLGRTKATNNSDWLAMFRNLKKAKMKWGQICRPLIKTGVRMRMVGLFYKAIVQAILLYGSETWVITPDMLRVLESFHNRTAHRIAQMMPKLVHGEWVYPSVRRARQKTGLYTIEHYLRKRQSTLAEYIATRPSYQLCIAADPPPPPGQPELPAANSRLYRWWTQPTRTTVAPEEANLKYDAALTPEEMVILQEALDRLNGDEADDGSGDNVSLDSEEVFHLEAAYLEWMSSEEWEETDGSDSDVTSGSSSW